MVDGGEGAHEGYYDYMSYWGYYEGYLGPLPHEVGDLVAQGLLLASHDLVVAPAQLIRDVREGVLVVFQSCLGTCRVLRRAMTCYGVLCGMRYVMWHVRA